MSEIRGAIKSHIKICVQVFLHTHGKNNKNELQQANPMAEKASTNAFFFGTESQVTEKTPPCRAEYLQRNTKINEIK